MLPRLHAMRSRRTYSATATKNLKKEDSMKKALLAAGAITTLSLAGVVGVNNVSANNGSNEVGISNLVSKIAEKFNLNEEEVQAVFNEEREARQAEHQQKLEERLAQAVEDGNITEDQKSAILEKLAELHDEHESLKDLGPEERRDAMKDKREELKQWANDNDIPLRYLVPFGGHRHMMHH
jgi:hypothetical protein